GSLDASGNWVGIVGPRNKSGGAGPIGTTLRDQNGDGILDLMVTNGQSGNFTVLPGVGQGFFDPRNPQVLRIPGDPVITQPPNLPPAVPTSAQFPAFSVDLSSVASFAPFFRPPETGPSSNPLAEATAPSEAPLALVLILVAGDLPGQGGEKEPHDSLAEANSP